MAVGVGKNSCSHAGTYLLPEILPWVREGEGSYASTSQFAGLLISWWCLPLVKSAGGRPSKQPTWVSFPAGERAENKWGRKCQMENNHHRSLTDFKMWLVYSEDWSLFWRLITPSNLMWLVAYSEGIEFWFKSGQRWPRIWYHVREWMGPISLFEMGWVRALLEKEGGKMGKITHLCLGSWLQ